jgi:hypothetical protein
MDEEILKITPDYEKAKSLLHLSEKRLLSLRNLDDAEFAPLIVEGLYEALKELITSILFIDGYKTLSHIKLVDYLKQNYSLFTEYDLHLIDELRKTRNKINYEGLAIDKSFLLNRRKNIFEILDKLKSLVNKKLKEGQK